MHRYKEVPSLHSWKRDDDGSYQYETASWRDGGREYDIFPVTRGDRRGYALMVFPGDIDGGYQGVAPDGQEKGIGGGAVYLSPQAAVSAAKRHAKRYP